ncbi:hypothetical protein [Streptomyces sp. ST2-7A]|uniref:hypothetical protein n=1 Tax=Streptomyces sp. ST2-7A TaxID=2907214 RepID=UPI001F16B5A1|nr:hypothetical protein [Streptomyces sp. ST2-7A]MCE7079366.1 hypothetical protein [Streptomyces sp. ST2-7A]
MYELSRIRLHSIGPAGARYADTVLDLRGVGAPVPEPAPVQADFFEGEPVGPPRRPAPAGVLFLENGGGKSVLLKLIFSVMLPGHRNTLGGASSGVLRKFLLADDCGHVALEWQHTITGETVVVGKVSEWRGRQVSSDPRRFAEAWYSFRPGPGLSLDSLPVSERGVPRAPDAPGAPVSRGRRRTMRGFRDVLTETGRSHPHLDVVWEEVHERWREHLEDLGLDPELFRYQREMNADEGEAAGLFAVRADSDFTDLLLRAVTDHRDTDGLADLVHGFAHKLGRREELTAERDFTAGSLDLLERIAGATAERERARAVHSAAEGRARGLGRRLAARAERENERTAVLSERATVAAEATAGASRARDTARDIAAELAWRHAASALADGEREAAERRRELAEARSLHAAWQAAEIVLQHRSAADRAARVAEAIREAERDAAPALAARARAAGELVRALEAAADGAEREAAGHERRSAELLASGEETRREATAAATAAQRARSEADHLDQRLAELDREVAEAAGAGWFGEGEIPEDPARAALAADDAARTAETALHAAREVAVRTADAARGAAERHTRARLAEARAADAVEAAEAALTAEIRIAGTLAAEPRVSDLLGADPRHPLGAEELDDRAEELRGILEEAVEAAERRLFEQRTGAAEDSRILAALGDGGLLPPGPDVLAAVEYLGEHGVPALPGWRYLAQSVHPDDHAAVLAARPELVDGVVVTDPDGLERAREILLDAALLPRSAVAVGTAAALLAPVPPAGRDGDAGGRATVFLVPPNPAMHDENAADTERGALRERARARDAEIGELAARLAADRALAARLASWRTGCPPGGPAALREEAERVRLAASAARRELDAAEPARQEAEEAAEEARRAVEDRGEAARRARRAADALAGLARRLRERPSHRSRLRELAEEVTEAENRAARLLERARAADEDRRAAQRVADDARRTARTLRAERAGIAGAPEGTAASDDAGDDPIEPAALPALREAYRAAGSLYEKVAVGSDLRAEQARAEGDESAARAALDRLGSRIRTRAGRLLATPDGADGPARQAAAARAEDLGRLLEGRAAEAGERLGRLRGEAERLAPGEGGAHAELPPGMEPTDAEHARTLLRAAESELARRGDALETARLAQQDAERGRVEAERAAADFAETAAQLLDLLREPEPGESAPPGDGDDGTGAEPYPGAAEDARRTAAESRRALRACSAELSAAEGTVREAADRLVRHANSVRFEAVRTPARQQIRELPPAALPAHAEAWAAAFAPRLRVLTDELGQLERNRDGIVDRLRGLVESSLDTLRAAQRLSRLPDGLGEWSGQEFLRIRFEEPDRAALVTRLGEVVDETTRAAVRRNTDLRRDGMSLLLRGVHAALVPRGVAVEILKPDAVLRAERVPVGQMGDVFSGGQLLTAAIALYCTMAALRGNDRGRDRHRHAGTLFLDNPIGRANATYLLELQRAVANALGVQLLYTTGLFDTTALAEFPLVIRLRNDADLRAGLKYISVEEHLRPGLPGPPADEGARAEITATRVHRRPVDPPPTVPEPADTPADNTPVNGGTTDGGSGTGEGPPHRGDAVPSGG